MEDSGGAKTGIRRLGYALHATAYEQLGQLDSAAVLWEYLATPHTPSAYSFAHFRLGKLYTELEQCDRAEEHYFTFLETFTQPDPD